MQNFYNIILNNSNFTSLFNINFVKQYLKIDNCNDDAVVLMDLQFAELYAQKICNISISPKSYKISTNVLCPNNSFVLPLKPLISVDQVMVDGVLLDEKEYIINQNTVTLLTNISNVKVYTIIATFGYKNINEVPTDLQMAILSHTAYRYNNRAGDQSVLAPVLSSNVYLTYRNFLI